MLDDCFTNYNEPAVARAATRVLETAGYRVILAGLACCGLPAISKGMLGLARGLAAANVATLAPHARRGTPIVACEPSCATALADDYRDLRLGADAAIVASSVRMVDAFVADRDRVPELVLEPRPGRVLVHGHCQQKAVLGVQGTLDALRRASGLEVTEFDAGCCGMAGSFGYEKGHYELSRSLAERVLLPAARSDPTAILAVPGFSCRGQLHDLAGIVARHPIEILADRLPTSGSREN